MNIKKISSTVSIKEFGVVLGTIVAVIVFYILGGSKWLNIRMIRALLHTASLLGIMAVGQSLLIIAGEFDISVGSVFGLCGVTFVTLVTSSGFGVVPAFIVAMLVGIFAGLLNGLFTLKTHIPSFIATLGGFYIYRGLVYYVTGGFTRSFPVEAREHALVKALGGSSVYGFNNSIIWCILISFVFSMILRSTVYGNRILCVGGDAKSALSRGVSVTRTKWIAFVIASGLAGFSGICSVSSLFIANTTLGEGMELESIAAAVLGGCSLSGGVGSIWGSFVGAILLSIIRSGLIALGAPPYWFITFVGIILIIGVIFNLNISAWIKRRYHI